jgi:ABC-type dipeptide/oligopeptide/nickel transport system permease subunit
MGLFEEYPWLLIPIIVVTVEGWNLVKSWIVTAIRQRQRG